MVLSPLSSGLEAPLNLDAEHKRDFADGGDTIRKMISRATLRLLSALLFFAGTSSMMIEEEEGDREHLVNEISFVVRPCVKVGACVKA